MQNHASFLIASLVIGLVWIALGMLVGGIFYSDHRGDEEIGVADTQGRDAAE